MIKLAIVVLPEPIGPDIAIFILMIKIK